MVVLPQFPIKNAIIIVFSIHPSTNVDRWYDVSDVFINADSSCHAKTLTRPLSTAACDRQIQGLVSIWKLIAPPNSVCF